MNNLSSITSIEPKMEIGCLSYSNEDRRERMEERFRQTGVPYHIFVSFDHSPKLKRKLEQAKNKSEYRIYDCMANHLSIIQYYYEHTEQEYILVCEDDVLLHKDAKNKLNHAVEEAKIHGLDILLVGCLLPNKPTRQDLYVYNDDLWGTQGYMLSRSYARKLLDKYVYGDDDIEVATFSADWTITKESSKRAYIYPLIFIEEGNSGDNNDIHGRFHQYCHRLHITDEYI